MAGGCRTLSAGLPLFTTVKAPKRVEASCQVVPATIVEMRDQRLARHATVFGNQTPLFEDLVPRWEGNHGLRYMAAARETKSAFAPTSMPYPSSRKAFAPAAVTMSNAAASSSSV